MSNIHQKLNKILALVWNDGASLAGGDYSNLDTLTVLPATEQIIQAMLDMPELQDEEQDKAFSTSNGGISNMGSNHCRNQLRAKIRTAIKRRGSKR